jgi:2-oxo-4-hydroxy-4-carboxy-5-ureidoimidazoline decarboxylase
MSIEAVNALSAEAFVAAFGDVAEHTPWVAEKSGAKRPFADRRAMSEAFIDAVLEAGDPEKLALIQAHPDLAGRVAIAGDLAPESKREQAGAGLDQLSEAEFARFTKLNDAYRSKFRFPFILAVKGADKKLVLSAFEERIENDPETEFANAIRQVARIVAFRIDDRVAP